MDTLEDRLREELRSPRYELPLESDRLLAGVSWSRRRRSMTLGAAALTVLVAAGGAVAVRGENGAQPPAGRPAGAVPASRVAADVDFLDETRGHVVVVDCTAGRSKALSKCHYELGTSVDGGQRWTYRMLPTPRFNQSRESHNSAQVEAFATGQLVLNFNNTGSWNGADTTTHRWHSADGGRTWQPRPTAPTGQVDAAPVGAKLVVGCDDPGECGRRSLHVLRPDGTMTRLRPVPSGPKAEDFSHSTVRSTMAADGSVWLSAPGSPPWIAVSRDRGRTWLRSELPGSALPVDLSTSAGPTTYVLARDLSARQAGFYRTTDDGRTWTKLALPGGDNVGVAAVSRPDGGALLFDDVTNRLYEIGPTGTTFEQVTSFRASQLSGALTANTLTDAGGRYLLDGADGGDSNVRLTSADGHRWQSISLD